MVKKLLIGTAALILFFVILFQIVWIFTNYTDPTRSDSMEPTYKIGDFTYTNPFETPKIGDVISFWCRSKEKCGKMYSYRVIHRWVSTDPDGCMHIIGDNPNIEWDKDFCLMPNEIKIEGVEHKLSF